MSYVQEFLFSFQYGGFLAVIFVLELGAGISIFAYRAKLTEGFDKGLTQAMTNYRNDSAHLADDFDRIQETVTTILFSNFVNFRQTYFERIYFCE